MSQFDQQSSDEIVSLPSQDTEVLSLPSSQSSTLSTSSSTASTQRGGNVTVRGHAIFPTSSTSSTSRPRTPIPPPPRKHVVLKSKPVVTAPIPTYANVHLPGESSSGTEATVSSSTATGPVVVPSPTVVCHKADHSSNKNVHVADRKHRGCSRNDLGGFFTS